MCKAKAKEINFYGGTYGLFSSTQDYLKFCQMILNGGVLNGQQILSTETVMMTQNQVGDLLGPSRGFGLGFGSVGTLLKKIPALPIVDNFIGVVILRHIFISILKQNSLR